MSRSGRSKVHTREFEYFVQTGKDATIDMGTHRNVGLALVTIMSLSAAGTPAALGSEWPSWRGPANNGMAYENAVVTSWALGGDNTLWKSDIGGRSTPVLLDGRLFFIAPAGKGKTSREQVVCLDADTGETIWQYEFNVFLTSIPEQRVGWTAVVADPETKYVYAHGTGGAFFCFDFDGNIVWEKSLTELYKRVSGYGGRLHTPIIDEDKVIISFVSSNWGNQGPPSHRYLAMNKRTGEVIWWAKPGGRPLDTTYCVPAVAVINGKRLLVAGAADGYVYGMKVRTGEKVWQFKYSKRGLNPSIIVDGNRVYAMHSEENYTTTEMGSVVCIDGSKTGDITDTGTIWRVNGIAAGYCSPALANDRLYVLDNAATLHCFDAKTGKKYWAHECGRIGKGSPTVTADGVIYLGTVNGRFLILKDEGDDCRELSVVQLPLHGMAVDEIFGNPVVVDGRVYLQTRYGTYCIGPKHPKVKRVPLPKMPEEAAPQPDKPATMLVVPGEVVMEPDEEMHFAMQFFDPNGRHIPTPIDAKVQTAVKGVKGTMTPEGDFTAADDDAYSAGLVEMSVGKLKGETRVRVCPPLPVSVTFDDMKGERNPPGWVGAGAKTRITNLDGNMVFEKLAPKEHPSAPFMRMEVYTNPPIRAGYTVQCDLMGKPRERGRAVRPDMGLINDRYMMKMMGEQNLIRLVTWWPIPRLRVDVPWEWKTGVWYTAKMRVDLAGETARVRAKVWPRGEEEPKEWRIEMIDPSPNFEGSPGLYAYSNGTKTTKVGPAVYFDNYKVYENEKE